MVSRDDNMYQVTLLGPNGQTFRYTLTPTAQSTTEIGEQGGVPALDFSLLCSFATDVVGAKYVGPFRNTVNAGGSPNYFDIAVGQDFVRNWDQWETGRSKGQRQAAYRLEREIRDIFGFKELQIKADQAEQSLLVVIDGNSYQLADVGSGLSQFIIVLANVMMEPCTYLLVDEPELHLHPSLQVPFMTALAAQASRGVVFCTHTIGLARAIANRTYSVVPVSARESSVHDLEDTPNLSELLGELSFSGYRELGMNAILLVEGPTDAGVWRELVKHYDGGKHVVPLPLGGRSMINGNDSTERTLAELTRASDSIFAIVDSDRTAADAPPTKRVEEFAAICSRLNITCHVLDRPSTENYLTDRAIKLELGERYSELEPFERFSDHEVRWDKHLNWRIARQMTPDDIPESLGQFLKTVASAAKPRAK